MDGGGRKDGVVYRMGWMGWYGGWGGIEDGAIWIMGRYTGWCGCGWYGGWGGMVDGVDVGGMEVVWNL